MKRGIAEGNIEDSLMTPLKICGDFCARISIAFSSPFCLIILFAFEIELWDQYLCLQNAIRILGGQ